MCDHTKVTPFRAKLKVNLDVNGMYLPEGAQIDVVAYCHNCWCAKLVNDSYNHQFHVREEQIVAMPPKQNLRGLSRHAKYR